MAENSMMFFNLDMTELSRLIRALARTLDKEIGKGDASQKLMDKTTSETAEFLYRFTHKFSPKLFESYIIIWGEGKSRGIWDPGGITAEIVVDPYAINRFDERPVDYAPVEFSRGADHDTFARASAHFGEYFEKGWKEFEAELTSKLGF